ncbi:restriction endonuclease subunit S [Haliscomenobacter sp.]|uniref:restriction endonuclease subunit S n=1 Tax=Haliscomenobacter sp. TaxID=2717303 RepID=UPI003593DA7C
MKNGKKYSLPKGWEILTIGDVCERGSSNVSQNQLENNTGDYPIFGASGLIKNVNFYHQNKPYLSIVKDGSGVGRVTKMDAYTSVIGTLQYILPKENVDLNYLYYNLISIDFKKYLAGAAIPHIYFKDYKNEPFLWMPLPEQQRIVAILDEAFAAITKAKANAEQNLKNAKGLFESYLQGVFEQQGEGWEEKTLSELCNIKHGFAFEGEYFSNSGDFVLLTPGNFYESGGYRDRGEKQKYYVGKIPNDYILKKGDLLVAMTEQAAGLLGSPILVPESNKFLHNQRLGLVMPKNNIPWSNEFFFHVFNTRKVRKALHSTGTGVKVRHTSPTKIGEVLVRFPSSISVQNEIVSTLNSLSAQTKKLEAIYQQKINDLEELKKVILQKAFSGELKTAEMLAV